MGFKYLKKYNEEISLILFCIGILLFSLGISVFHGFRTHNFFYVAAALFIVFNYTKISKDDFIALKIPILCFVVLFALSLLTMFDDVMPPENFNQLYKNINQNIFSYFALIVLCFLFARHASKKHVWFFLVFFAFTCALNVVAMIYLGVKNGLYFQTYHYNTPFYFKYIFAYHVWLLAPMAVSVAGLVLSKSKISKIIFFICIILTIIAMLANGERSFLVATIPMFFTPFIVCSYKYKRYVIPLAVIALFCISFVIYHFSKDLPHRYNVANMIDNISSVWNTDPIEMGKYDEGCFNGEFTCFYESIRDGKSNINWEHSSLVRIAMVKSTLLAFLDEPLKPHIVGVFLIGGYLYKYYDINNSKNRVYMSVPNPDNEKWNGYNSPHNLWVSILFSYGLIGALVVFMAIVSLLNIANKGLKNNNDFRSRIISLSLIVFLIGLMTQVLFDVLFVDILKVIFIASAFSSGFLLSKSKV